MIAKKFTSAPCLCSEAPGAKECASAEIMLSVTCAIIIRDGKIFAAQRCPNVHLAGKWEFPGGKVDDGESEEACIVREIGEELGVEIRLIHRLADSVHDYGDKQIRLIPFECELVGGEPIAREHASIDWFYPSDLMSLDWCDADIPIVKQVVGPGLASRQFGAR